MKTVQEMYDEIMKDEKLKKELVKAYKADKVEEFAKAHGCNASMDEIIAFAKTKIADHPVLSLLF